MSWYDNRITTHVKRFFDNFFSLRLCHQFRAEERVSLEVFVTSTPGIADTF
jgi:hypothetical protein